MKLLTPNPEGKYVFKATDAMREVFFVTIRGQVIAVLGDLPTIRELGFKEKDRTDAC